MTARKIHFAADKRNAEAYCGATPRLGAPDLDLTTFVGTTTCTNCLKAIQAQGTPEISAENAVVAIVEAAGENLVVIPGDVAEAFAQIVRDETTVDAKVLDLADRYDLDVDFVEKAIADGWLKI